jgi:hypothetical protein
MPSLSQSRRFRLKVLACLLNRRVMARYGTIVLPRYFDLQDEHEVCEAINNYWTTYRSVPPEDDLLDIVGDEHVELVHSLYLGVHDWDLNYAADRIVQFAQEQAAKLAVLESLTDVEQGDLSKVISRLKEAMAVGEDIGYKGIDVKKVEQWLHLTEREKVPTGLIHLDIALGGGLAPGELGVFLAPPNYGKSLALVNVGFGAAGPIFQGNVIHFSLEMNDDVIAKRYAARMLFQFPSATGSNEQYKQDFNRYVKFMMPGNVRALRVKGDVNVLRSHIDRLIDEGFEPDLIIVDYGDEVDSTRHYSDHWIEAGSVFKELRDLGHDYGCPVWTATQANRSALGKEIITMKEIGESIRKAAIADAIAALCQTREEEQNGLCRIFLAKLRDGKARRMIRAKYFSEAQALITIGFVGSDDDLYGFIEN